MPAKPWIWPRVRLAFWDGMIVWAELSAYRPSPAHAYLRYCCLFLLKTHGPVEPRPNMTMPGNSSSMVTWQEVNRKPKRARGDFRLPIRSGSRSFNSSRPNPCFSAECTERRYVCLLLGAQLPTTPREPSGNWRSRG